MSLSTSTEDMQQEDAKNIHDMRNALIDAFTSIINGIKSPQDIQISLTDHEMIQSSIVNMFYFIEGLMKKDDLSVNPELARQVLDLYSDIVMLQYNDSPEPIGDINIRRKTELFNS